jgi:type III pantothenate kinase
MARSLICVDIGNSRIKIGRFTAPTGQGLPQPNAEITLRHDWQTNDLAPFVAAAPNSEWWISSVHGPALKKLEKWIAKSSITSRVHTLTVQDIPLRIDVEQPSAIGMDRLVSAVAANVLREPSLPAVVIAVGSAITVNLLSAEGTFCGGAILPGIEMSAKGMHQFTDRLPLIPDTELSIPPAPVGCDTISAMKSGLFWGAVGGMRELIERMTSGEPRFVILTGGAAPRVAQLLNSTEPACQTQYVADLALCGIALVAQNRAV